MKLECPKCNCFNQVGSFFCNKCGMQFKPKSSSNNATIAVIILVSLFSICGLCGIIGSLSNPNKSAETAKSTVKTDETPSIAPFVSTDYSANENNSSINSNLQIAEKNVSKTAIVIADFADLREAGNKNASVIQTIPEDSEVVIIKQKGAWFYVNYTGNKGWIHGNSIKFKENSLGNVYTAELPDLDKFAEKPEEISTPQPLPTISRTPEQSSRTYSTPTYPLPEYKPTPSIQTETRSSSTATALCADGTYSYSASRQGTCSHHGGVSVWLDGSSTTPSYSTPSSSSSDSTYRPKTVNVRGYYRKDGTYVRPHTRSAPRRRN